MKISNKFPKYKKFDPLVPVWCVTPNVGRTIHRFFDTSPFSPSGRFMALFRFPYEDKMPSPGDTGEVILVDLETAEEKVVAKTCGWEFQMGANINWGKTDNELFFNDVDTKTWKPFCVKLDPFTGKSQRLEGAIYRISPDGKKIISANMLCMRRTQYGYGVWVPDEKVPRHIGPSDEDGLYITDTKSGKCKLVVSIRTFVEHLKPKLDPKEYNNYEFYGFHCKYNMQGDRLMFTLRWYRKEAEGQWNTIGEKLKYEVFTLKEDGSEIYDAIPNAEWEKGEGHHTNWFPDGENLSMNLSIDGEKNGLFFTRVKYDGSKLGKIIDDIPGSGHPTVHPDGVHVLTDDYLGGRYSFADGSIAIRLVDIKAHQEKALIRINTLTGQESKLQALRVDPHPAWDKEFKYIALNAFVDGTRRVYIADISKYVGKS